MNIRHLARAILAILTLAAGHAAADPYDPPAGYYDSATATSSALLSQQLNSIIDDHIERSYDNAKLALQYLDADATDPLLMVLIYDGQTTIKQWDAGATWNREHTWPRSRGVDDSGPDNSDLHMLRPCTSSVNGSRGNLPFGLGGSYWDPAALGAPDRGEIARAQFYADVRYDGADAFTTDLTLVPGFPTAGNEMGDLDLLLQWHFAYPPDERELRRNHLIWSDDADFWFDPEVSPISVVLNQGNRNPFVDRPESAWTIWGGAPSNATLTLSGAHGADGASSVDLDLGTVIVGAVLATTEIDILKSGNHPAAYSVTTSGDATSPDAGLPLTYPFSPPPPGVDFPTLTVGLDAAGPGLASGTVTVDNRQRTSAGPGQGSDDADDVVNLTATVLDHANASFDSPADDNTLTIDFGDVPRFSTDPTAPFDIHNIAPAPFAATLDLDMIDASGDTGALTTDLTTFAGLTPGGAAPFTATLDADAPAGPLSATYTLTLSDEDLPGATEQTLTLTLLATLVPPACDGDLDGDGDTDVSDFGIFASNFGEGPGATRDDGDLNDDGFVTVADFAIFASDFGCSP